MKSLIVLGIIAGVTLLVMTFMSGSIYEILFDLAVLLPFFLVLVLAWPTHISTDNAGVHQTWIGPFRRRTLAWTDIGAVRKGREFKFIKSSWLNAIGVRFETLDLCDRQGRIVIRHTARHPDRDRYVKVLRQSLAPLRRTVASSKK